MHLWLRFLLITLLFLIEGCSNVYKDAENTIKKDHEKFKKAYECHQEGEHYTNRPLNMVADFTYQPTWLKKEIILKSKKISFFYVMDKIAKNLGVNVIYNNDLGDVEIPDFSFRGSMDEALKYLMLRTNYAYQIDKNTLSWSQFAVKTFDITFLPGETSFQVGGKMNTTNTASSGSSDSGSTQQNRTASNEYMNEFVELKGTGSIWKDIEKTIESLLSPDGAMTVSPSLTSVTVRDRPSHLESITNFLDQVNKRLSQQVLIKITVLEIQLSKDYAHGIDWQSAMKAVAHWGKVRFDATGKIMLNTMDIFPLDKRNNANTIQPILTGKKGSNSTNLLIRALEEQGDVSISTRPTVVTLNNQVAQVKITNEKGYLAKSEVSTNGTTTTTAVTPGLVSSGMTLYLLPKIFNNQIYLQLSTSLSQLNDLEQHEVTSGTGASVTLQTPIVASKNFNQRVIIRSGDTLILSGFKQVNTSRDSMALFGVDLLAGKTAASAVTETVMLVTPYLSDHDRPHSHMLVTPTSSKGSTSKPAAGTP